MGPIGVGPPVVPPRRAGATTPPFRTLCRRYGVGLYVSEMITARALVEGNRKTLLMASFDAEETTRSLRLYGVDPFYVGEAVRLLVGEGRVDHLDLNFGCPVRKVTSRGGGAAIPVKPRLLRSIVRSAVGGGCCGGRGLSRALAAVLDGGGAPAPPGLGGVMEVMWGHPRLLVEWLGDEASAMRAFRKHPSWYTKGFRGGAPLRQRLMQV